MDQLKQQIADLNKKTQSMLTEESMKKWNKDMIKLTDDSRDIRQDVKSIQQQINDMNELKRKLVVLNSMPTDADFNKLKNRMDVVENVNNTFKRRMDDLDRRIKILEGRAAGHNHVPSSIERLNTDDAMSVEDAMKRQIDSLEQDFKSFKEQQAKELYRIN